MARLTETNRIILFWVHSILGLNRNPLKKTGQIALASVFADQYAELISQLIEARKKAGLSQSDVASQIGKPQSFVSKYERRERRLDAVEFLQISRAIGADPHKLLKELEEFWNPGNIVS